MRCVRSCKHTNRSRWLCWLENYQRSRGLYNLDRKMFPHCARARTPSSHTAMNVCVFMYKQCTQHIQQLNTCTASLCCVCVRSRLCAERIFPVMLRWQHSATRHERGALKCIVYSHHHRALQHKVYSTAHMESWFVLLWCRERVFVSDVGLSWRIENASISI